MERDLKCMYCAEAGITNTDVFIEIVDVELGAGWICKECFLESEKEKDEHLKELEDDLKAKEQESEKLKEAQKNSRCAWKSFEGTFCPEAQEQLDQLKSENKHLNDLLNQALKELEKTRETLTEIKEIAEMQCVCGVNCQDMKIILQKISEVEDANI